MYLVFFHSSWLTVPQTLGIFWSVRAMGASFVIFGLLSSAPWNTSGPKRWNGCLVFHNKPFPSQLGFLLMKVTLDPTPVYGAGCQENQPHDQRVGTLSPAPWFLGKGKELEVESIAIGQWFSQSWLCNEASIKAPKDSFLALFQRASTSGNQNTSACHISGPQVPRGHKISCSGPRPMYLFIWLLICIL